MTRLTFAITISGITLLSAGVVWFTDTRGASDVVELSNLTPQGPGLERYADPVRGFFFDYPAGLKLVVTDNGEDHVIFGDTREGDTRFLITAYPSALSEPLTEDIIRANFPDVTSAIDRVALPSGAAAFLSQRTDTPMGATRDALFTHNGTAYHLAVVADFEELFTEILQSWRFTSSTTQ